MVHDRPTCEFVWSRRLRLERIAELRGAIQAIDGQVSAITSTQQSRRRPNFDFIKKVQEVKTCFLDSSAAASECANGHSANQIL